MYLKQEGKGLMLRLDVTLEEIMINVTQLLYLH